MILGNGRMFFGDWHCHKMKEGKLYELQEDDTYTLFSVKFDTKSDIEKNIAVPN
jgi:hypothetical protein